MINERYKKNLGAFSQEEFVSLQEKSVFVVGCGGIGGCAIETLARFGIGRLSIIDGDVFEESNLNRQVFSTEKNLGESKALATEAALKDINSQISVSVWNELLTEANAFDLMKGHDIVMDCLDNIPTRLLVERTCENLGIPFVHGAISGFSGQVCSVFPGDRILQSIYPEQYRGANREFSAPPFILQMVAAIQCSEALKILTGKGEVLRQRLLMIDLLNNSFDIFQF